MARTSIAASTPSSASLSAARPTSVLQKASHSRPASESRLHGFASSLRFLRFAAAQRFSFGSRRRRPALATSPGGFDGQVYLQRRTFSLERENLAGPCLRNGSLLD